MAFDLLLCLLCSIGEYATLVDCNNYATRNLYVSSAGLRLLLMLQKGMKNKGGSFRLKNIQNDIMEILNITGFSHILTIE